MNKIAAIEWLRKSWHNLSGAKIFYDVNHYTDVTAVEIHYSVEKSLKAFLAYENKKILKTHDLYKIAESIEYFIKFNENELDILGCISEYYIEESYPAFDRKPPSKDEIEVNLDFSFYIFERVCKTLDININEVKR